MKKIFTIVLSVLISGISFSQNNERDKIMSSSARERCKNDVDFLYQMAQKEYPEAEYLFAKTLHYDIDIYNARYKKYWAPFSENNNLVAAAYYFKKACEHGWTEAYDAYVEYCYYGRGEAIGGVKEAIKWQEKALENDTSNWRYAANLGIFYLIDDIDSNDDKGVKLLNYVTKMPQTESEFFVFLGRACYYGIGLQENRKIAVFLFAKAISAPEGKYDNSKITASYYLAYCLHHGIGIEKNDEEAKQFLDGIQENFFDSIQGHFSKYSPTMKDCDHKIQKYDLEYSNKKTIIDLIAGIF